MEVGGIIMDLFNSIKYVLFTFADGTHFVVRTTLSTTLAPKMEPGCLYDLDRERNIPIEEFEETTRQVLDEYPEEYREESEFYAKLRYGV